MVEPMVDPAVRRCEGRMSVQKTTLVLVWWWNTLSPLLLQLPPSSHVWTGVRRMGFIILGDLTLSVANWIFLHNMGQMPVSTWHQEAPCAQLWWGVQRLHGARDELHPPSPEVPPFPAAPASSRAGMGMLVPRAVCSAPSAREQMPAASRAVSHTPFMSTKIQIS